MAKLTPQQHVEKWARRTTAATEDYRKGVMNVTEPPGVQAARQKARMQRNLNASLDSGHWERRVSSVSLADWQQAAAHKGGDRINAGVQGAQQSMLQGVEILYADLAAAQSRVSAMPRDSFSDSIARMNAHAEVMHQRRLARQTRR